MTLANSWKLKARYDNHHNGLFITTAQL